MRKVLYKPSKMRERYRNAKTQQQDFGAKRAVFDIGKVPLCEQYGIGFIDWDEKVAEICKRIAYNLKGLKKCEKSLFRGDIMDFRGNGNGKPRNGGNGNGNNYESIKGCYFGGVFWKKPAKTGLHKVCTYGDGIRLVTPPELNKDDISIMTEIDSKYIIRRA